MRLLPGGANHVRDRAHQEESQTQRRRHRHGNERQHLPLRHLSADSRRDQASCERRDSMSSLYQTPQMGSDTGSTMNRRDFLRTISELGGLVLIAGVPGVLKAADKEPKYGGDGMAN